MKARFAAFLALLLVSLAARPPLASAADRYARLDMYGVTYAQVISVIDGDSMRVRLTATGEEALVRLVCVDATGRDDAFNYLASRLTGQNVTLETDPYVNQYVDRWNLVYMDYNGGSVNADMLASGFAEINTAHRAATMYRSLTGDRDYARLNAVGRWAPDEPESRGAYAGNGVNINTATASQLENILSGVGGRVASNIVSFRGRHPFRSVCDIKFVYGFTKEMFDANRRYMTVSTNINTATREELRTLEDVTAQMVQDIIDARRGGSSGFRSLSALYTGGYMPRDVYDLNRPFMSTSDRTSIAYASPDRIVNINTATSAQLTDAGFTSGQAGAVIEYRGDYGYKTAEELMYLPGASITSSKIDELADNLSVRTDINAAASGELRSLLGAGGSSSAVSAIERGRRYSRVSDLREQVSGSAYEALRPYVYTAPSDAVPERVNLNTASRAELTGAGLTSSEAAEIERARPIEHPGRLPFDISAVDEKVSLYTNINEATRSELLSLSGRMTSGLADEIIAYRRIQPFSTQDELREFFSEQAESGVYQAVRGFVVFR